MCLDFGIPQLQAAGLLAAMGMFDLVGTIGSGWLSDRYDNRYLLFWYYGLRGVSLLFLPFTNFSFYGLSLFAMIYGLDWIATVPPTAEAIVATISSSPRSSSTSRSSRRWTAMPRCSTSYCSFTSRAKAFSVIAMNGVE